METITIRISLQFTIREFPLSISETFLVIQQTMEGGQGHIFKYHFKKISLIPPAATPATGCHL